MDGNERTMVFEVFGMSCGHCKAAVEAAIKGTPGVETATVDLAAGKAVVEGVFSEEAVLKSVTDAGYDATVSFDE